MFIYEVFYLYRNNIQTYSTFRLSINFFQVITCFIGVFILRYVYFLILYAFYFPFLLFTRRLSRLSVFWIRRLAALTAVLKYQTYCFCFRPAFANQGFLIFYFFLFWQSLFPFSYWGTFRTNYLIWRFTSNK